jgi:hypothetical protein
MESKEKYILDDIFYKKKYMFYKNKYLKLKSLITRDDISSETKNQLGGTINNLVKETIISSDPKPKINFGLGGCTTFYETFFNGI